MRVKQEIKEGMCKETASAGSGTGTKARDGSGSDEEKNNQRTIEDRYSLDESKAVQALWVLNQAEGDVERSEEEDQTEVQLAAEDSDSIVTPVFIHRSCTRSHPSLPR